MAEANKRNSIAGKVATPKPSVTPVATPIPSAVDPFEALAKSIGARIKLTTVAPLAQTYEGTLFTADPIFNLVAIDTRATSTSSSESIAQHGDYHMIPISKIQTFQVLSLPSSTDAGSSPFASARPPIGPVDVKRLKAREQAKINKLKEEKRNKGDGVTPEAQAIYDALKRINMPIRWHNQQMVVHEAVIISAPYRIEDCKGPNEKQEVVSRVKKVLEGERKKLKEKEERERKTAIPVGPRKGG